MKMLKLVINWVQLAAVTPFPISLDYWINNVKAYLLDGPNRPNASCDTLF